MKIKNNILKKYVYFLIRKRRFTKLKNLFWVYPLWLNYGLRTFIISRIFPFISKFWKEPYPPFLEIEHTTKCPLKCIVCEHTYWNQPEINMSFERFRHVIDQFPRLKWIGVTGIGESFSNPDFINILEHLDKTSKPIIEVVDNMYMMTTQRAEKIIKSNVDILFISIQGMSSEVNEVMFGQVMKFDAFEKNLKSFFEIKRKLGSVTPIVNFHYIVSKPNKAEVLKFMDYAAELNEDIFEVLFTPLLHSFPEVEQYALTDQEIKEVRERIINYRDSKNFKFKVDFNEFVKFKLPFKRCSNWIMPFIFASGDVNVCCTTNEANNRERQLKHTLGNVFEQSFKEIWYGKKYQTFRNTIRKNTTPKQCNGCPIYIEASAKKGV